METTVLPFVIFPPISSKTSAQFCGFTATTIISLFSINSKLFLQALTLSSFATSAAVSGCFVVKNISVFLRVPAWIKPFTIHRPIRPSPMIPTVPILFAITKVSFEDVLIPLLLRRLFGRFIEIRKFYFGRFSHLFINLLEFPLSELC